MKDEYRHRTEQKQLILNILKDELIDTGDSEESAALLAEIQEMEVLLRNREMRMAVAYAIQEHITGRFVTGIGQTSDGGVKDMPYFFADIILETVREVRERQADGS